MKASYYNHFVKEDGKFLIFNALRHSITEVDNRTANLIKNNDLLKIDNNVIDPLKNQGLIVEDEFDEKNFFLFNYHKSKFNSDTAEFIILTTYRCNLACPYCYEGHGKKSNLDKRLQQDMNFATAQKTILFIKEWCRDLGIKKIIITLFGGEPFLNPKIGLYIIQEIFNFANENNLEFNCTAFTNGTLLTEPLIESLSHLNFNKPLITIDGDKEYHDRKKIMGGVKGHLIS